MEFLLKLKKRPFLFLFIFLAMGIVFSYWIAIRVNVAFLVIIMLGALFCIITIDKKFTFFIGVILFILGIILYQLQFTQESRLVPLTKDHHYGIAKVLRDPIKGDFNWQVDIKVTKLQTNKWEMKLQEKARLLIYHDGDTPPMKGGQWIKLKDISSYEYIEGYRPEGYNLYLKSNRIDHILSASANSIEVIDTVKWNPLISSLRFKGIAEEIFDQTLGYNQGSLAKSMVFGNQGYLSEEVLKTFSRSGTAHVIAISGLHVGIIILILGRAMAWMGFSKNTGYLISLALLLIYGYIAAFPVSIIRAIAMFGVFILGYNLHRPYDSINGLSAIAFIILLFNPIAIFSVSFQLSFAATMGIILLYPKLNKLFAFVPKVIGGLLAVTISAQLATIPIIAYHFKEISIVAWLANLLIVPFMSIILGLALFSIILGILNLSFAVIINQLTNLLLSYTLWVVEFLSSFNYSSIEITNINVITFITYYIFLIVIYHLSSKRIWGTNK